MSDQAHPTKVWTSLITNLAYLPGILTLEYSLRKTNTKYPLVVLYTDSFPAEGHAALDARGIIKRPVPHLTPSQHKDYTNDPRFYDCWTKLAVFSMTEYERIVMLDSDMLITKNMDELMEMDLDGPELKGEGNRVFAAGHACCCNPMKKAHYPTDWIPANCALTSQHSTPDLAQTVGPTSTSGLAGLNSGLLVINPCQGTYEQITAALTTAATANYDFADQSLLNDVFRGRWVGLPYIYNALKTLRWEGVHDKIWRDDEVKVVHYIWAPKPWNEIEPGFVAKGEQDPLHKWWIDINAERLEEEKSGGL